MAYCWMRGIRAEEAKDDLMRYIPMLDAILLEDHYTKQATKQRVEAAKAKK